MMAEEWSRIAEHNDGIFDEAIKLWSARAAEKQATSQRLVSSRFLRLSKNGAFELRRPCTLKSSSN